MVIIDPRLGRVSQGGRRQSIAGRLPVRISRTVARPGKRVALQPLPILRPPLREIHQSRSVRTGSRLQSVPYAPNPTGWIDPFGLCEEDHFVYRVLRDDEDPTQGLVARNPNATYKPEGFVLHGSKPGFKSQYIASSRTLAAAQENRERYGNPNQRIVKIDTRQASSRTDLTGPNSPLRGTTAKNRAAKSQEVLLTGPIPPSAISPAE